MTEAGRARERRRLKFFNMAILAHRADDSRRQFVQRCGMFRPASFCFRLLAACSILAVMGCGSMKEGLGATSDTMTANMGMDVETAVGAVFEAHGYSQMSSDKGTLIFERPGSKTDEMLYGDFSDSKTTDRVRVIIDPIDPTHFRVTCVGYAVRQPTGHFEGDTSMEDPVRRFQLFSSQFSQMLREVKARLHS